MLTASRFDPLQVPDDWKPDPSRIWDLRSDIQQSMNSSALGAGSSSASHQQWKAGISANEVRQNIALWFNLMKLFCHVAGCAPWRDAVTTYQTFSMGLHVGEEQGAFTEL